MGEPLESSHLAVVSHGLNGDRPGEAEEVGMPSLPAGADEGVPGDDVVRSTTLDL